MQFFIYAPLTTFEYWYGNNRLIINGGLYALSEVCKAFHYMYGIWYNTNGLQPVVLVWYGTW